MLGIILGTMFYAVIIYVALGVLLGWDKYCDWERDENGHVKQKYKKKDDK